MKSMSWEYVAGFFDGEGCICAVTMISKHYPQGGLNWSCQITQCDRRVLDEIAEFLTAKAIKCSINRTRAATNTSRDVHVLGIRGGRNGIYQFIKGVFPYLRVKKVVAQDTMRTMILCPPLYGRTRIPRCWSEIEKKEIGQRFSRYWTPKHKKECSERVGKWWASKKAAGG